MTWQTITISDILDHYLNTGPFDNQTQIYHLNTRLVQYSDPHVLTKVDFLFQLVSFLVSVGKMGANITKAFEGGRGKNSQL